MTNFYSMSTPYFVSSLHICTVQCCVYCTHMYSMYVYSCHWATACSWQPQLPLPRKLLYGFSMLLYCISCRYASPVDIPWLTYSILYTYRHGWVSSLAIGNFPELLGNVDYIHTVCTMYLVGFSFRVYRCHYWAKSIKGTVSPNKKSLKVV